MVVVMTRSRPGLPGPLPFQEPGGGGVGREEGAGGGGLQVVGPSSLARGGVCEGP